MVQATSALQHSRRHLAIAIGQPASRVQPQRSVLRWLQRAERTIGQRRRAARQPWRWRPPDAARLRQWRAARTLQQLAHYRAADQAAKAQRRVQQPSASTPSAASPAIVEAMLKKSSILWPSVQQLSLTINERVRRLQDHDQQQQAAFSEYLLQIGEGREPRHWPGCCPAEGQHVPAM